MCDDEDTKCIYYEDLLGLDVCDFKTGKAMFDAVLFFKKVMQVVNQNGSTGYMDLLAICLKIELR